jgi:hypothetical protein
MYFRILSVAITTFSSTRHMLPQPDWPRMVLEDVLFVSRGTRCDSELTYGSYCKLLVKFVKMHVFFIEVGF